MAKLKSGTRIYGTATIDTSVVVGSAVTLSSSGLQVTGNSLITGISTVANLRITPVGTGATVGGIGVTYYGDGSQLTGISAGVSISTNTTNANQYIPYATSFGSTTGLGATTLLVYNPSSGNLGIGTTNPSSTLYVQGNAYVTGVTTSTDFNSSSDINLKDNIQRIENPIDKVLQLDGVTFNWKDSNRPSVGIIAQQVEKVLPQLVSGDYSKTVNYNGLIGLLIEAIKEQQKEIEVLKKYLNK
jgi:hypothetical protein